MSLTPLSPLSEEQMLDVMAYADGELAADDEPRVRALVEEHPEAKELLASVRALGDGVRVAAEQAERDGERDGEAKVSADLADAIMRRIQPNDFDKARIRRTNRVRMGVVAASLVALAAGVFFYVRQNAEGGSQATNNPAPPQSTGGAASLLDGNALASLHTTGVEVDSVDTPSSVSVFYVPSESPELAAKGGNTVVVWVDDSAGENP